jgi:anhydro-N-acetylmuramic acid kinase
MAAGGQGAPLVPPFHAALFQSTEEYRAILNIGGISNLTLLPNRSASTVTGFDVGPGNGLMDAWISARRGLPFDDDGGWSRTGTVNNQLLERLSADPYFGLPPPKSTGREYFNLLWLQRNLEPPPQTNRTDDPIEDQDVQATLRALSAAAIAAALTEWGPHTSRVIVCGGGRLNSALLDELRARLQLPVDTTEDHGVDGDSVESAAFAWLAHRTISEMAGNAPAVTGASGPRILGAIYHA